MSQRDRDTAGRNVALLAGGGLLLWLLLRGGGGGAAGAGAQPRRPAAPVRIRVDGTTIAVDGTPATLDQALHRAAASGAADVKATGTAETGLVVTLLDGLARRRVRVATSPELRALAASMSAAGMP